MSGGEVDERGREGEEEKRERERREGGGEGYENIGRFEVEVKKRRGLAV